jgi:hypothetical protein
MLRARNKYLLPATGENLPTAHTSALLPSRSTHYSSQIHPSRDPPYSSAQDSWRGCSCRPPPRRSSPSGLQRRCRWGRRAEDLGSGGGICKSGGSTRAVDWLGPAATAPAVGWLGAGRAWCCFRPCGSPLKASRWAFKRAARCQAASAKGGSSIWCSSAEASECKCAEEAALFFVFTVAANPLLSWIELSLPSLLHFSIRWLIYTIAASTSICLWGWRASAL